jgi:serine/threonine protein kinase/tetratricopeptide (TPR) repeat protein
MCKRGVAGGAALRAGGRALPFSSVSLQTGKPAGAVLVGPYRLVDQLGGGGMGIIWRAEHVETGERVALKTVRMPEPRMLASIRREIHALTRLRHPGVVQVVGQGVAGGLPWYAMELLTGRTLTDLIQGTWSESQYGARARTDSRSRERPPGAVGLASADTEVGGGFSPTLSHPDQAYAATDGFVAPAGPGDPGQRPPAAAGEAPTLLRVVLGLSETLAVLHGAGVVHRDLKPDNVFVRPSGAPVLVDFGLAAHGASGREILEAGGAVVGTLHYMAPEQLQGAYVDARADLYSLGCILYESLTGRPPFVGEPMQVAHQHLHTPPPPPSQFVAGVAGALDELVLRLLHKDPRERFGYAEDVAAALAGLLGAPAPPPSPRQLYRPGFAGRAAELGRLEGMFEKLAYGAGAFALVRAESGAGKTRLMMEFARRAAAGRPLTLTGECVAVGLEGRGPQRLEAAPLHPFRDVFLHVVDRCHKHGEAETARLLGGDLRLLAEFEPALLSAPGAAAAPSPPALPGEARRQQVVEAMTRMLTALARPGPLLLLLDDLQWADELSLAVLAALPTALPRAPALVLGACRSGDEPPELQALAARPGVHGLALAPLADAATRSIVADMLALREPPAALVDGLDPADAGNPFFVGEVLQVARDDGLLVRDDGGWRLRAGVGPGQLPRTRAEVCDRRLAALAPATRRLVDAASALGRVLDLDLLTGVDGMDEDAVLDAVDDLILRRVVQRPWTGGLCFVDDGVLAAAYARLPGDRRGALHRQLAERLEARDEGDRALPQLAHHWSRAGAPATAFAYLVRNARRTLAAGAHHQAGVLLQRAWALVDEGLAISPQERAEAALRTAEAALGTGDVDAAQARIAEVLRLHGQPLPSSGPGWALGLALAAGRQFVGLGRRAGKKQLPDATRAALAASAQALSLLQQSYVARGDTLRLLAACFMAANTAEASHDAANPAIAYSVIGAVVGSLGLQGRAAWYFERAAETSRRLGDAHAEVAAGVAECSHYIGAAMWARLADRAAALAALGKAIGARHEWEALVMIATNGRVRTRGLQGARDALGEVIASSLGRSNELSAAWARATRAEVALWAGDLEGAEADATLALPVMLRGSGKGSAAVPRGVLARVHLERGQLTAAGAEAHEALAGLRGEGLLFMHEPGARLAAEVLLELWARAQAAGDTGADALRRSAARATGLVRGMARQFAFARAAALRLAGQARRIAGRPAAARRLLERALAVARAQELGHEQAMIELERARCAAPGDHARAAHLARAREIFDRCHLEGGLERVARIAEGRG